MDPKRKAILQLMSQDATYENHFFKTKKNPIWFFELKSKGYFEPKKNPSIQPADREGYYVIPQWNVLEYLERVADQVNVAENEKYIDELLEIIKSVSTYKNEKGEIIDNYRTWWFFIKILLKLPNSKIPLEILDLVPIWLSSKYGGSLVDADAATKLLPKFLYEGAGAEDVKKAERLIGYLTDFIWVEKRGVFTEKEQEAKGLVEDHWLIESFIENGMAKLAGKLCGKGVIYNFADKLKTILNHSAKSKINIDFKGKTYRLTIGVEKDFTYICRVGTYEKKTTNGEEDFRDEESIGLKELLSFNIEAKDTESFSGSTSKILDKLDIPKEVNQKIKAGLNDLYRYIFHDYSYIWFKDLPRTSDSRRLYEFKHVLLAILAESFFEKQNFDSVAAKEIVNSFLSDNFQHQIFKRLVIAFVSKNWTDYKDVFWKTLITDKSNPLLEDPAFEDELRKLLRENVGKFTADEKKEINCLIEIGPQKYVIEENKDKYILYWKQRWYGVLKNDKYFLEKYEAIKKLSTYDDQKDPERESGWIGPGTSPLTEEDILKITNLELAQKINNFKEKDILSKGPSSEGLAKALESAVHKQPDKFTEDLEPFIDLGFFYLDYVIDGFKSAWADKVSFDWNKLFKFLDKYIDRPAFWTNKLTIKAGFYDADNKWVIGAIGELIQEGTKNDEWSIPDSDFPIVKRVFSLIASKAPKDKKDPKNYPNHVINCGLGKVNIGLLYLTLRIARLTKTDGAPVWDQDLKTTLEVFLTRNIYDAYTVLGENLISFAYLDKQWTEQQIRKIGKTKDETRWEAFMSGYVAASRVNLDLYLLMKSLYVKALSFDFEEKILNERLIDHIGIGYLNGVERIDGDGLLKIIWKKWDAKQITALIGYLWSQRDNLVAKADESDLDKQMRTRIIQLWSDVVEKISTKASPTKDDKEILSDITKLIVFVSEINEEVYKWLMLSAPYIGDFYDSAYLFERLNDLKDKGDKKTIADKIAKIFLEILGSSKPDYDKEDIRSIVEYLYQVDDPNIKKQATTICDEYAKAGIEIVSDIYDKYNQS